jgi:hypothetical protein
MPKTDIMAPLMPMLKEIEREALWHIRDRSMVRWPLASRYQMNIRRGVLRKSITSEASVHYNVVLMEIGSRGEIGSAKIGWLVQEMHKFYVRPRSHRYMPVPLRPAMDSRGVKLAPGPRLFRLRARVGLRIIRIRGKLFLGYYDKKTKQTVLVYWLRDVVKTKSAKILEAGARGRIVGILERDVNKYLFSAARVYVRGDHIKTVRGHLQHVSPILRTGPGQYNQQERNVPRRMSIVVKR